MISSVLLSAARAIFGFSAISEIATDNAEGEAVFYNLQGIRVNNPANGLYIKVQGGNTSKVLVK